MKTILFVCTGNSCRSVMAAEMLKKMLGPNDKVQIFSAGVATSIGLKATDHTLSVLQEEGIDASGHRSTPLLKSSIESADLIIVMERFQKDKIIHMVPQVVGKVHLLREFKKAPDEITEPEVPDPIGRPREDYVRALKMIKEGLENLVKWLKENGWV